MISDYTECVYSKRSRTTCNLRAKTKGVGLWGGAILSLLLFAGSVNAMQDADGSAEKDFPDKVDIVKKRVFNLMMMKHKIASQNYELRQVETRTTSGHDKEFSFKTTLDFHFTIHSIKNIKMCSKTGLHKILLGLTRTGVFSAFKGAGKGARNRWLLLDHEGREFLHYCWHKRKYSDIKDMINEMPKTLLNIVNMPYNLVNYSKDSDYKTIKEGKPTHPFAVKLRKQSSLAGKGFSWSYEARNVKYLGKQNADNAKDAYRFKFVGKNGKTKSGCSFNMAIKEIVLDKNKGGPVKNVLIKMRRVGWNQIFKYVGALKACDRYLLLDKEGIQFLQFIGTHTGLKQKISPEVWKLPEMKGLDNPHESSDNANLASGRPRRKGRKHTMAPPTWANVASNVDGLQDVESGSIRLSTLDSPANANGEGKNISLETHDTQPDSQQPGRRRLGSLTELLKLCEDNGYAQ